MRFASACVFVVACGCGGKVADSGVTVNDASSPPDGMIAVDTSIRDVVPIDVANETRPIDTGPYTCAVDLFPGFACEPAADKPGKTVCTDEAIEQVANACFGFDASAAKCEAARKKFPACASCMLIDWINGYRIDVAACMKKVAPGDSCSTSVQCAIDCLDAVCGGCDDTPGTGRTGSRSELDDCQADAEWRGSSSRPKGRCYDVAVKDARSCYEKPELAPCVVSSVSDLLVFYRGACRDGGNWSKASSPLGDAGSDAAGEAAVDAASGG